MFSSTLCSVHYGTRHTVAVDVANLVVYISIVVDIYLSFLLYAYILLRINEMCHSELVVIKCCDIDY